MIFIDHTPHYKPTSFSGSSQHKRQLIDWCFACQFIPSLVPRLCCTGSFSPDGRSNNLFLIVAHQSIIAHHTVINVPGGRSLTSLDLVPRLSRAHGRGEGKKESLVHTDCACSGFSQKSVNFVIQFTYVQMRNINDVIDS